MTSQTMPSDWRLVRPIRGNARAVALRQTIFVSEIQLDPGPSRRVAQKCYSVDIGGTRPSTIRPKEDGAAREAIPKICCRCVRSRICRDSC